MHHDICPSCSTYRRVAFHKSCCSRCHRTRGKTHNSFCHRQPVVVETAPVIISDVIAQDSWRHGRVIADFGQSDWGHEYISLLKGDMAVIYRTEEDWAFGDVLNVKGWFPSDAVNSAGVALKNFCPDGWGSEYIFLRKYFAVQVISTHCR